MSRRGSGSHPAPEYQAARYSSAVPEAPPPPELAGLARRLASLLYEALLLLAILFLGSAIFTAVAGSADSVPRRVILDALLLLLVAGYFVWCWSRGGQTLPMQAWRLRVVDVTTGNPPAVRKALKRYLTAIPGILLGGASFVYAVFDRDRQFLHDRLAGTRIVEVRREK